MPPERILGVDLGGTRMRAALVAGDGAVSRRQERPTFDGARASDGLIGLAREVLAEEVEKAVVAVPGRVDYRRGALEHSPNLTEGWVSALRESWLEERLGIEVTLVNDADVAAVGEAYFGAGRDHDDVVYVTVSTGVGAGVVLGGSLVAGRRSGSEIGHTVIDRTAAAVGEPATIEDLASGTALEKAAHAAGLPGDGRRVLELVAENDRRALTVWREVLDALFVGVANLAHLFTPQVVVVGGGVGLHADALSESIRSHLRIAGPRGLPDEISVAKAALGDDAGLAGAAAWGAATRSLTNRRTGATDPGGQSLPTTRARGPF